MVKRRIIGFSLLPILLLTSCTQRTLRSDIKEFIASFSLEDSIKEYQFAAYDYLTSEEKNNVVTVNEDHVSFDVRDDASIAYSYTHKMTENDVLKTNEFIYITTVDSKYYYESQVSEIHEISKSDVDKEIITFFYRVEESGYHGQGMYYGDIVKDMIYDYQNYTKIDEENELLIIDYEFYYSKLDTKFKQTITVNKLGMLVSNYLKITAPTGVSTSSIDVYKK